MTQSFDYDQSSNTNANAATTGMAGGGGGTNAEYDLKDAQLDEASASTDQHGFGPGNILGGGIGNLTQQASQVVSLINQSIHRIYMSIINLWLAYIN